MSFESTIKSLQYMFDQELYNCNTYNGRNKYRAQPYSIIKSQSTDHAIIEYEGTNPVYTLWYASYLTSKNISTDIVKEIRLIGNPMDDSILNVRICFPNTKIIVIQKTINELKYEDLYCQHSLVLHFLGNLFLEGKAIFNNVCNDYQTLPRRHMQEQLATLIRQTRFIYDLLVYNCEGEDMKWQMEEIIKIISPDTIPVSEHNCETNVVGHFNVSSLNYYRQQSYFHSPKIEIESEKFEAGNTLFYGTPLKNTVFLSGLPDELCGNIPAAKDLYVANKLGIIDEIRQNSPYEIASEFRIYKWVELFDDNDAIYIEILNRYKEAANKGVFGANNCLGVFYVQTQQYKEAKNYFLNGVNEGDEHSIVNLWTLSKIEENQNEIEYWKHESQKFTQIGLWNDAVDSWNNAQYVQFISCLERIVNAQDRTFEICGRSIFQMALKNLIKIYSEGKSEVGVMCDFQKVQRLLSKVKFNENKELIACCLVNNFITPVNSVNKSSNKLAFQMFETAYKEDKSRSNHSYNLACCYVNGLGCKEDAESAIEICKRFLAESVNKNVQILLGYLYYKNGKQEKGISEIENVNGLDYSHMVNLGIMLIENDKFLKGKLYCEDLIKKPGCVDCHEALLYDNEKRVCPKVLKMLGDIAMESNEADKAKLLYMNSAKYGFASSHRELAKIMLNSGKIEDAKLYLRKALYFGDTYVLLYLEYFSNTAKEKLRLLLLLASSGIAKEVGRVYYDIYELLKQRTISKKAGEEYFWLEKSADIGYEKGLREYTQLLRITDRKKTALRYLRKHQGNCAWIQNEISDIESEIVVDRFNSCPQFVGDDSHNSNSNDEYARDTWYALTDGMYGDYPEDIDKDDI